MSACNIFDLCHLACTQTYSSREIPLPQSCVREMDSTWSLTLLAEVAFNCTAVDTAFFHTELDP